MPLQDFDRKAITLLKAKAGEEAFSIKPLPSVAEVPATFGLGIGFALTSPRNLAVVRKIAGAMFDGSPMTRYMRESTKPTVTSLCATLTAFGRGIPEIDIEFYDKARGKTLAIKATDSSGRALCDFNYGSPGIQTTIESFIYPRPLICMSGLNYSSKLLSVWTILLKSQNVTDVWERLCARALGEALPRLFWKEKPHTIIGLAGKLEFLELVPVFEGQTVRYEVGVSAWCNTPEPYPSEAKCDEYRKNTWWQFDLYASNTAEAPKHVGGGRINVDYHLVYNLTATSVTLEERRYVGK